jgi:CRISPR/Cas system-associated exonuclease Cas4 (RecB family)
MHYLGLDECLFTAINMNTMAIYEERVVLDFECIENTQLLVKNVFSFTDRNKFLPKSMNKYDCTYCDYKEHCK